MFKANARASNPGPKLLVLAGICNVRLLIIPASCSLGITDMGRFQVVTSKLSQLYFYLGKPGNELNRPAARG